MSTNDLSKDSANLYDLMTLTTQFPQYMGQMSKSCYQSSPSSTAITGHSQNNTTYQSPLLSSMTPAQQQVFQKNIPNSMHFWNSKEFINVTNGGNLMSLSENRNGKNASTNFLTGGTTTVMSDNYRQMSATDIFCQDFASLPAVITGIDSSVHEDGAITGSGSGKNISGVVPPQTRDVSSKHQSNDPNILRGFSEPCLLNVASSEVQNDSRPNCLNNDNLGNVPSTSASNVEASTNKLFAVIMEHIQQLHDTNSKIYRNLHETKVDIEALKYAPYWNLRHRRDSISGLSTHSQPVMFGGGFSTQSSTSPYSGVYNPGMMTDIVREVKDAARVREDAMINRVKSLVEERQWSLNEYHLKIMRDLEDIKTQLSNMYLEKKESNKRISHLEDENRQIWQLLATLCRNHNASNVQQIVDEHLNARLQRKSAPGPSTMHLKYQEFKEGGSCTKCTSPNATMTPSYFSNAINRHFRTSGAKNNGYATTVTSPLNSAIISPAVNDLADIPLTSTTLAMSGGGCGLSIKGPRPPSSNESHSLTGNHHAITEITPPSNDNENRAIVLENLVGMLQVQSSNRRHLNSTCHETTPQQFINSEGHINISSGSIRHFTSPPTTFSNSTPSFKRNFGLARDLDAASLTHSNNILLNNNNNSNCNMQKNMIKMTERMASGNNQMHNNIPGVQNKLSIAGPITDL